MKTKMKSLMTIAIALFTITTFAQQGNRKPPTIEKRVANVITKIEKEIEINAKQKATIEDAFTVFFTKVDKESVNGKRPEKSVIESCKKERDAKIKITLSEGKYEEYLKISDQLKPKHQHRRENGQRPK